MEQKKLWGHPVGLYILFFTELWERFSFYGMRAILILYLTARTDELNSGLGWDNTSALQLYGWYTMLVYAMGVPGGILADRLLGQKKSVILGGILIILGHALLVINGTWEFYSGLFFIILGVGALKPNISSMVGGLYRQGDGKRDSAFTIFYMGINVGAFSAPLIVGYIGEVINWNYGFGLAGIGMAIGQIVFVFGQKYLKHVGNFVPHQIDVVTNQKVKLTTIEKDRIVVLLLSFLIVIVFWMAYEQAGGLMNLFAKEKVNRVVEFLNWEVPASWFQSLHAFYVIILGIPMAGFWIWWSKTRWENSSLFKMGLGTIITGFGFMMLAAAAMETMESPSGLSSVHWLFGAYLLHVVGELCISPVALSFITKMAPIKYVSFIMGGYFFATALGNKLAGLVGEAAMKAGELTIFWSLFGFCVGFGFLLILFVKKLKKLTHGADDVVEEVPLVEPE
jgi:POT family proton-dependent oligopeptide transporter